MKRPGSLLSLTRAAAERLSARGIDSALRDAEVLLASAGGWTRAQLVARHNDAPSPVVARRFERFMGMRVRRIPVAYIVGEREFFGLPFSVNPSCLIPRPETEVLVEHSINLLKASSSPCVAEIGTGSGCIAVSLANHVPGASIIATDISRRALAVARRNIARHDLTRRISLAHGHGFEALEGKCTEGALDMIVSNPPYIPQGERDLLAPELNAEPARALFAGEDGLEIYRILASGAGRFLRPGGFVAVELNENRSACVAALFSQEGFVDISVKSDLAGRDRVLTARWDGEAFLHG